MPEYENLLAQHSSGDFFKNYQFWDFQKTIFESRRYLLDDDQVYFLKKFVDFGNTFSKTINHSNVYYRARIIKHHELRERTTFSGGIFGGGISRKHISPYTIDEIIPTEKHARNGRFNPDGIPFLYLSDTEETAASEIGAYKGSGICIGEFFPARELKIFNVPFLTDAEAEYLEINQTDKNEWNRVYFSFTEPATVRPERNEYAPTQILAEAIKSSGFDGIEFDSSVSEGRNLVLFDTKAAECKEIYTREVISVKVSLGGAKYSSESDNNSNYLQGLLGENLVDKSD